MKTKITLGNSVKTKVNRSVTLVCDSVDVSVYSSVSGSVYWLVRLSVRSSINNSMIWRIEL